MARLFMVVPVFLPHSGCTERCIYCHQGYITDIDETGLKARIDLALAKRTAPCEVGLFGGNIFGIQTDILQTIFSYFSPYKDIIEGFRISTKPVPLRVETIKLLKENNVRIIELGIPVFNDAILKAMNRAHTASDLFRAHESLKCEGFGLALQFMVGLPHEEISDIHAIVENMLKLRPAYIRIYPLVVLKNTPLYDMYEKGDFIPVAFDDVLEQACYIYASAMGGGIEVANVGLTDNELVRDMVVAGFYHPAYGFLVQSRLFFHAVEASLKEVEDPSNVWITIHKNDIPLLVGYKRENIAKLSARGITIHWDPSGPKPGKFEITTPTQQIPRSVF
ncbi:MAG: radical SAM protein [Syntrophorhabdaceae bacterium]